MSIQMEITVYKIVHKSIHKINNVYKLAKVDIFIILVQKNTVLIIVYTINLFYKQTKIINNV